MPRYIAENDVYNLFNARGVAQLHVGDIDVLPRVDVVEVVHGRCVYVRDDELIDHYECSVCHKYIPQEYTSWHYCPNCGAKMDLEEKRHEIF